MSMEINGSYNHFGTDYAEGVKEKQAARRAGEATETNRGINGTKVFDKVSEPHDEYISSEKSGEKPSGLYRVGQDENGSRKIYFEDPNRSGHKDEKEQPQISRGSSKKDGDGRAPKAGADHPEKSEEKCVGNTDKVDREIRKLKEKKKQLEQQIQSASKEEKVQELEKKLAQVENELSRKDNDTYRRQNSSFQNL